MKAKSDQADVLGLKSRPVNNIYLARIAGREVTREAARRTAEAKKKMMDLQGRALYGSQNATTDGDATSMDGEGFHKRSQTNPYVDPGQDTRFKKAHDRGTAYSFGADPRGTTAVSMGSAQSKPKNRHIFKEAFAEPSRKSTAPN